MIIKGLFRRYKRWNPVHPTSGAFLGMGVGIGCGVGWGPGFGPEVIGYVGAGCGIGFNVGITFAGFGIGLPANILIEGPYKVITATSIHAWDFVRSSSPISARNSFADEWDSSIWSLQQKANESLSYMKNLNPLKKGNKRFGVKKSIALQTKSISDSFNSFKNQFSDPKADNKN